MTKVRRHGPQAAWLVLGGYWLAMAVGTHLPPTTLSAASLSVSDKALHLGAYFGLAVLAATTWRLTFGWFHRPAGLALLVALAAIGAADELTQPYFRRSCDIRDWAADVVGAAIGLVLFRIVLAIIEMRRGSRVAAAKPTAAESGRSPGA